MAVKVPIRVQRRNLLQQAVVALAAAGTTGPAAALEVIRNGLTSSVTHGESPDLSVEDWEKIIHEYGGHRYFTAPPSDLIVDLAADIADLQQQIDRAGDETRERELYRISGHLAAMLAMSLGNANQLREARRWWFTARAAADASTDPAVRTWVRGKEAGSVLWIRRPLQAAVDIADEVQAIGGLHPGTVTAMAEKARVLALMGRASEAVDALRSSGELFEQLPAKVINDWWSVFGWGEYKLRDAESHVHTHLGNVAEAGRAQESALLLYDRNDPRSRASVQFHQAICQVHEGNIEDGTNHAQSVIKALPGYQRNSAIVRTVGQRVLEAIPAKERRRASVADLHDLLAQPTVPNPN